MDMNEIKNKIIMLAAALFAAAMVAFPQITEAGSKTAIIIWANSIVPVLLPFFIFSDFIKRSGNLQKLPPKLYSFVIAFMSGYPVGAKVVGDFLREKSLTLQEGKFILSYSLITGPAFILFTVGEFIGSSRAAVIVAIAHYIGALLNARFYSHTASSKWSADLITAKSDYLENFTYAIIGGFKSMAIILAYLMVFTIGINLLEQTGIFVLLNNETLSSCLKGFLEMTVGINMMGMCDIGIKLKTVLAAMMVSFGGLSVIGQSGSMLKGSGIKITDILKIKTTHAMLAAILATLITNFMVL